jgi:Flp pilus assembly protein TadB
MAPLFTTALGWFMLGVVLALQTAAYFVIKKIITIDV